MNIRAAGDRGLLLELRTNAEARAVATALRAWPDGRFTDVVPGHRTVLVTFEGDAPAERGAISAVADAALTAAVDRKPIGEVTIAVTYDGPDLAFVAEAVSLSPEEVVRRHCASEFVAGFLGFAPGFAYLLGLDARLHVPRLAAPRTSVPAGSVAIAGPYGGVYPRASPGGWRLLGRTDAVVFDPGRDRPALIEPGMRVRFEAR